MNKNEHWIKLLEDSIELRKEFMEKHKSLFISKRNEVDIDINHLSSLCEDLRNADNEKLTQTIIGLYVTIHHVILDISLIMDKWKDIKKHSIDTLTEVSDSLDADLYNKSSWKRINKSLGNEEDL